MSGSNRSKDQSSPLLEELIEAYQRSREGVDSGRAADRTDALYGDVRARFVKEYGVIVDAFFAKNMVSGAVLVRPYRFRNVRHLIMRHDGEKAAEVQPRFESALWRVRRTEREAGLTLSGRPGKVLIEMLFSVTVYLLSVLDSLSNAARTDGQVLDQTSVSAREQRINAALTSVGEELDRLDDFVQRASKKLSLRYYLLGFPVGAIAGAFLVYLAIRSNVVDENTDLLAICLACGGIGAIISVMLRISRTVPDVDTGQGRLITLLAGAFRSVIGAVFGAALFVFVKAGFLPLEVPSETSDALFFFGALAFLAGFNERWAQDTIVRSAPTPMGVQLTHSDLPDATPRKSSGSAASQQYVRAPAARLVSNGHREKAPRGS